MLQWIGIDLLIKLKEKMLPRGPDVLGSFALLSIALVHAESISAVHNDLINPADLRFYLRPHYLTLDRYGSISAVFLRVINKCAVTAAFSLIAYSVESSNQYRNLISAKFPPFSVHVGLLVRWYGFCATSFICKIEMVGN